MVLCRHLRATLCLGAVGIAFGLVVAPVLAADRTQLRSGLEKLFVLGEKNTPVDVAAARKHYQELRRQAPGDARIDYAYALVLARQHRYLDALPLLSQAPPPGASAAAMQVKVWSQLMARRDADAMDGAVRLARLVAQQPPRLDEVEARQAADFLGAVFGFLEYARPDSQAKLRDARKAEVEKHLGARLAKDFSGGAAAVVATTARLEAERQAIVDKQVAATTARRQQAKATLDEQQNELATQQEAMQGDAQRVDALRRDQQKLAAQMRSLQDTRSAIARDVEQIVRQFPDRDRDDAGSQQERFRLLAELQPLEFQARQLDVEIAALQTRVAALGGAVNAGTAELRAAAADQRKAQRRVNVAGKRLEDQEAPAVRPGPPLGKMAQFSTYAELPYQQEKTRVLDWFAR